MANDTLTQAQSDRACERAVQFSAIVDCVAGCGAPHDSEIDAFFRRLPDPADFGGIATYAQAREYLIAHCESALGRLDYTSDHSLLAAALCRGVARWEPFSGYAGHGEVCVAGLRWATKLDKAGIPELHAALRAELRTALNQPCVEPDTRVDSPSK